MMAWSFELCGTRLQLYERWKEDTGGENLSALQGQSQAAHPQGGKVSGAEDGFPELLSTGQEELLSSSRSPFGTGTF